MSKRQSSDADRSAEDAVVAKIRGGVAQTDLTADELAAWARVNARTGVADEVPAPDEPDPGPPDTKDTM